MRRGGEVVRRTEGERALARHLDEQRALFTELNNRAVERGRPMPYPDVGAAMMTMEIAKREDGNFLVTMRPERLEEVDWDLSGHAASVRASKPYSERAMRGFNQMSDGETRLMLEGNMICTVERSEIAETWNAYL